MQDSIKAQLQIRQNALEAQEYAQDLLNWQKTVKAKPKSSSSISSSTKQQYTEPVPVRGRADGAVQAAPKDLQRPALQQSQAAQLNQATQQANPAAHTYKNYSKWDKFDVDAALQDPEEVAASSSSSKQQRAAPAPVRGAENAMEPRQPNAPITPVSSTNSNSKSSSSSATEPPPAAVKAAGYKDQGNKLFQAKYYDEAVSCYTQSIKTHPTAVAYANRAMAFLKLDKHAQAEADCSAAIELDPAYVKAWHRRGTARKQLGKLLDAAGDFEAVLRLEPDNTPVQADRDQALEQHLKQQQIQPSSVWHSIPVELQQASPQQQQQQQPPSSPPQQQQQASATAGAIRPVTPVQGSTGGSKGTSPQLSPQQRQSVAAAAQAAAQQLAERLASSLKPPRSGHEFESAWRSLKGDVQLQGKYLRLLQPQQLPALFKSSLTAQLVTALLTALLTAMSSSSSSSAAAAAAGALGSQEGACTDQPQPDHAVSLIEGLVHVPRFDMMAMSLGSKDKAALRQQWDTAAAAVEAPLQKRLAAVRPTYRL